MEVVSLIIAILALVFSGITYFAHDRRLKKQEEQINAYQLEKQQEEKAELKKAAIRANIVKGEKGKRILKVFNAGKSVARDVDIKLLGEGEFFGGSNPFPYEFLNPQEGTELVLFLHMGSPDKLLIELSWADDYEENNTYRQLLTL